MNKKIGRSWACPSCGETFGSRCPGGREQLKDGEQIETVGICSRCRELLEKGIVVISVLGEPGDKYREWTCRCGHTFAALVQLSEDTVNLSGEKTAFCPECGKKPARGSEVKTVDRADPYRTGSIAVLKREAVSRIFSDNEGVRDSIMKQGMMFLPDEAWDMLGLPRESQEDRKDEGDG
jgi:transcription elongation factor Elf1